MGRDPLVEHGLARRLTNRRLKRAVLEMMTPVHPGMGMVHVLDPQAEQLHDPQTAAVHQLRHEPGRAGHRLEQPLAFLAGQHRGHARPPPRELEPRQVPRLPPERLTEQEDQRIERLLLSCHRHAAPHRQVAQKGLEVLAGGGFQVPGEDKIGQAPRPFPVSRYPLNARANTDSMPGVKPQAWSASRQLAKITSGTVGKGRPDAEI